MIWRLLRAFARSSFGIGLVLTIGLIALQALCLTGASFLGANMGPLKDGITRLYPDRVAREMARVIIYNWLWFSLAFMWARFWGRQLGSSRRSQYWLTTVMLGGGYVCALLATIIRVPAMYEPYLFPSLQVFVWHMSWYVSPSALMGIGLAFFAVTPLFLIWRINRTRALGAFVIVGGIAIALFTLPQWQDRGPLLPGVGTSIETTGPGANGITSDAPPPPRPNILVIAVDSMRFDRLTKEGVLPHLHALTEDPQTITFAQHHVGVPRTFPSWVEIIQGQYNGRTGIRHMFPTIDKRERPRPGFVRTLRDSGYHTHVVSDFAGDIFPRFDAGFDVVDTPGMSVSTVINLGVDQMFPLFFPMMLNHWGHRVFTSLKTSPAYSDAGQLTDRALYVWKNYQSQPLMLTVFFSTAHFPYAAPYPYYRSFADSTYAGPFKFQKNPTLSGDLGSITESDMTQVRALYDGALKSIDDQLGRLFAHLKKTGQWDRTMIVVTADHGEDLYEQGVLQGHGEHLRGDNVLRVPLVIKLPNGQRPPTPTSEFITRSIDIAPTILTLANVPFAREAYDGVDLGLWINRREPNPPSLTAYSESEVWFANSGSGFFQQQRLDYPGISGLLSFDQGYSGEVVLNPRFERILTTARHRSITTARYKLIYIPTHRGVEWELYDRVADPANRTNLAATMPEVLATMQHDFYAILPFVDPQIDLAAGVAVAR